jgi:Zn ribbon nucleic-acid-binding protein
MPLVKTELYFCKDCNKEIDRHLFEHWLAAHNHKGQSRTRTRIYDYYDTDPSEQQEYYLWSRDNIEFSRCVPLNGKAENENEEVKDELEVEAQVIGKENGNGNGGSTLDGILLF